MCFGVGGGGVTTKLDKFEGSFLCTFWVFS